MSESLIAVNKDSKWGYVDTTNKPIIAINLKYETVSDFSDGLAAVFDYEENSDNLQYGYIDKTGKLVIPMQFTKAYWDDSKDIINFHNGIAIVNDEEGRKFCIDKKGDDTQCPDGVIDTDNQSTDEADNLDEENVQATSTDTPQFVAITDYLALKPNESWTWDKLAAIPYAKEWFEKTPVKNGYSSEDPNYSISASLNETSGIHAYGTKNQPNLITLGSGQGIMEDEQLRGVYELNDFFNQSDLTRIPSNCDVDSLFKQKFYKWEKKGFQTLYIYDALMLGNSGASAELGIAKSLEEFFKPEYEHLDLELQSIDNNNDGVTCTFNQL